MNEDLKNQYRKQLKRDPDKDFGPEFIRTTDLEKSLIDEYGFEAVKLIFEQSNSANFSLLGEFPEDCPWSALNGKDNRSTIDANFEPIAVRLPQLMEIMKARCRFIYADTTDTGWQLHYLLDMTLYDGRPYYHIYTGGAPNPDPQANQCLRKFQWDIPDDLRKLYVIHDGFGPILSSYDISVMAEMMDPICKQQNYSPEEYRFSDLLEFHPDGAGNAQCFYRTESGLTTVDWDHEIWEISGDVDFFEYLDDRLSVIDEE